MHPSRPVREISPQKKLLFSLLTVLLFLGLLEGALALLGVRPVTETRDPFVGFTGLVPLMQPSRDEFDQRVLVTATGKRVWFNDQTFPERKSDNTVRVFCLGGSTTYGRPYDDTTSYVAWLRELLPLTDPSRNWEVINAGGISYASYRVAAVMEELSSYDPDLFIVLSGHNEFLERRTYQAMFDQSRLRRTVTGALSRTRTWALLDRVIHRPSASDSATDADGQGVPLEGRPLDWLPAEVDEMLNHSIGPADYHRDDPWRQRVLRHYELNLQRMITIARGADAEVVLITLASNEKDMSPFKSEPSTPPNSTTTAELHKWRIEAADSLASGDLPGAAASLAQAVAADPRDASLHFDLGRLQFQLGRYRLAQESFLQAITEDVCPLRAVPEISEIVRRVCRRGDVAMVDFEQRLRSLCEQQQGHRCLGNEYFLDHVHPTVEVHGLLAQWIIEELQAAGVIGSESLGQESMAHSFAEVRRRVMSRIDPRREGVAMRNLAKVFHWAGKFEEARVYAYQSLDRMQNDAESRFILADSLTNLGRPEEAVREYERLYRSVDAYPKGYLACSELLFNQGHDDAAKAFAILAVAVSPGNPRGHFLLGSIHLRLGEYEAAAESLAVADSLYPDDPVTLRHLAEAWLGQGEGARAIQLYHRALGSDPDNAETHHRLGLAYLKEKRTADAISQFRISIRLDPQHAAAGASLKVAEALRN